MKDTFFGAKLVSPNLIRVAIFSSARVEQFHPILIVDGKAGETLRTSRFTSLQSQTVCEFRLEKKLELGHSYFLHCGKFGLMPLDVTEATSFPGFDEAFFYAGEDLGATYSAERTTFKIWAPLASKATLLFRAPKEKTWQFREMRRGECGVYELAIEGDLERYEYLYRVVNNEVSCDVTDPYAKGSTQNGETSVVVDFSSFEADLRESALPAMDSPCDAIIYEGNVRDLTSDPSTDIAHKGTFLGLAERGRKTEKGHPAGLDYFAGLGITHLQLLPIFDFKTVDETDPSSSYNWGYDPAQYFVPEGSYASVLDDPYSRIKDLKAMVAAYHEKGIRIVMDVVFNHVYEFGTSVFERVVPNFYFRKKWDGSPSSQSGCGNDLDTARPMVRKLIIDACLFWIKTYGIDGFRFDLMGLIDVKTLNRIAEEAQKIKPDFLLYGEGWNMDPGNPELLGKTENASAMPKFGFFNDGFREAGKRYFSQDLTAGNDLKYAMASSSVDFIYRAKYLDATQSINYLECHDDNTLFDALSARRPDLSTSEILRLIMGANASITLALGIPFFHAGQEIGQSKWGERNTYNKGDDVNRFSYRLLDERWEMAERFKRWISLRHQMRILRIFDPCTIDTAVYIDEIKGVLRFAGIDPSLIAPYRKLVAYLNMGETPIEIEEDEAMEPVLSSNDEPLKANAKTIVVPSFTLALFGTLD